MGLFPIKVHGAGFQELGIIILLQNLFYDLYFADLNSAIQCRMSKNEAGEWQCNECYKTSKVKTNILEHIEAFHIQSSGYECEICCKVFKTRHSLRTHRNVKHKEVKYTNYKQDLQLIYIQLQVIMFICKSCLFKNKCSLTKTQVQKVDGRCEFSTVTKIGFNNHALLQNNPVKFTKLAETTTFSAPFNEHVS